MRATARLRAARWPSTILTPYQVRATLDALLGRLERELAKEAKEVAMGVGVRVGVRVRVGVLGLGG